MASPPTPSRRDPPEPAREPPGERDEFVALALRVGFVLFVLSLALQVARPFVGILLWAAVLTVSVYPLYAFTVARTGGRSTLVALALTLAGLLVVFGPVSLLAVAIVDNVRSLAAWMEDGGVRVPPPDAAVRSWPVLGPYVHDLWARAHGNLGAALAPLEPMLGALVARAVAAVATTGWEVVQFALAVLLAGYLLARADRLGPGAERMALSIGRAQGPEILATVTQTIRQVSRGVIGVSLLQTILAWAGLAVAGVPAAGLISFGTLVLAISQIGPNFLLIPVAVWSFTFLDPLWAVAFSLWIVPVSFIDNLLKPIVFARGLATPMWVIVVGVVGGTIGFGLIGIFVGPVVLAVAYDFFRIALRGPDTP